MFNRVLIAEDHESASISVRKTLEELKVSRADYVYYCDDALLQIKKALQKGEPYDLLITDLSFEDDGREQQLTGGEELIAAARAAQPNLKVLVFSAEIKPGIISDLFTHLHINGFVRKARRDAQELRVAIDAIYNNRQHLPILLKQAVRQAGIYELTPYDKTIVSLLAQGIMQKDIPNYLQRNGVKPSSLSSVEKRLNFIRDTFSFTNNEQLVAFCKGEGHI